MAQARRTRKSRAKASPKKGKGRDLRATLTAIRQGMGFFVTGLLSGVMGILFWQGYQSETPDDLGSGIKSMITQSKREAQKKELQAAPPPEPVLVDNAPRIKAKYDFYTVLPEIEEVLPRDSTEQPPSVASVKTSPGRAEKGKASPRKPASALPAGSAYMLQVASYGKQQDAERLKAKLALNGLRASIQKVSIERKKYFRVRIGPYSDFGNMTADDYKLTRLGFKAMRLRVSKAS